MTEPCARNRAVIDIETTGLKPEQHQILELTLIITDPKSTIELGGYHAFVHYDHPAHLWQEADEYVKKMHTENGLWAEHAQACAEGRAKSLTQIGSEFAACVRHFCGPDPKVLPLGCNVEALDVPFLRYWLPEAASVLHYRSINVSSLREIVRDELGVEFEKEVKPHRSTQDCRDAIELYHKCLEALRFEKCK